MLNILLVLVHSINPPPVIFSFLGDPTSLGAPTVKDHRKVAPKGAHADKGPLQKGAPTDKELVQTRGPYRQRTPMDAV